MSLIEVTDLVIKYKDLVAVNNVSFSLNNGIILLLGPNGSGKSSIIKALLGIIKPWRGRVRILNCRPFDTKCLRDRVHVLFEETLLPEHLRVREYLEGISYIRGDQGSIEYVIEYFGLGKHLDKRIGELSKGLRRRVAIASLFIGKPDILIMDEPYNGLDIEAIIKVNKKIEEYRKKHPKALILLSTHIIPPIVPDKIILLRNGSILYFGKPPKHNIYVRIRQGEAELELDLNSFNRLLKKHGLRDIMVVDIKRFSIYEFVENKIFGRE